MALGAVTFRIVGRLIRVARGADGSGGSQLSGYGFLVAASPTTPHVSLSVMDLQERRSVAEAAV